MPELEARPVLPVPHDAVLVLRDGRRLRRWAADDRRRQAGRAPGLLDFEGYDGPQGLIVLCSLDDTRFGPLLHVSVSYQKRDPSWADLKAVRYACFPRDQDVVCMLPRDDDYVSGVPGAPGGMDSHVFHLNQPPDHWGIQ